MRRGKAIRDWNQMQGRKEKQEKQRKPPFPLVKEREKTRHADEIQAKYAGT